ncbi:dihydroxyacetone kinase subunit DhaL [Clostridium saudiense]|uniref:dihydroxyacetone kinase subunit DhaL n=1 Tax=Clostridium saudiense TaxID=1414720 RepID=UPI00082059D3|nr:dihydroxyacetone kinase subunit DhaL [Clostridium saudiense]MDU7453709.1 dihydroxyacetone kinase subunit DhaL [Clostridium saudiense]SCJ86986.1 PTS-dependent dihydroxyacetone kinase%2C ADP-binding subunit dhaL [uncultured Clostridium sp.]
MEISNKDAAIVVNNIIHSIKENREYLSEIDGAIGDGDHGINMSKGFSMAEEILSNEEFNMSDGFLTISQVLMNKIGGSMGPLYGSFFRGLSMASKKSDIIDKNVINNMLKKALANLQNISNAKVGDKTLIDVLVPAVNAYSTSIEEEKDLITALNSLIIAAKDGLESTKNLVASIGRSSRLGDRSLGHQDAGATSCFIILKSFCESFIYLIQG